MAGKDADIERIKELIEIMKANDLAKIEIRHGDDVISLRRNQRQQPAVTAVPVVAGQTFNSAGGETDAPSRASRSDSDPDATGLLDIVSPIVGTFYEAPSPDSEPYVDVGSHVDPQAVVCIIEAMKVMNEIKAEVDGTVVERLVDNGQAVEYGQVLFRVRPD